MVTPDSGLNEGVEPADLAAYAKCVCMGNEKSIWLYRIRMSAKTREDRLMSGITMTKREAKVSLLCYSFRDRDM